MQGPMERVTQLLTCVQATEACKSREPEAQLTGTVTVLAALGEWMDFQVLSSPKCSTESQRHMRNYRGVLSRGCRGWPVQLQQIQD